MNNDDTVQALETALRLAKAGQIRGAVMFFAYHDDRHAFRICDVTQDDVLPFSSMMGEIGRNFSSQWMERSIEGHDELPTSLRGQEEPKSPRPT